MKNTRWKFGALLAGTCLYGIAGASAVAQDASGATQRPRTAATTTQSDAASAAATMPTWEAYGSNDPQTLEETFFRLSRDFVSTSELGVRRLGAVPIWPRGELKFGPVRLLPYLRQAVEYESNFYKQPETGHGTGPGPGSRGRDAQWTHVNQVGLLADTVLCGGRARISASADSIWSVRYDHEKPDTWEFDGQLGGSYRWPSGIWAAGGIAWERRNDPTDITTPFVSESGFERSNRRAFLNVGMDRDIFFGSKVQLEAGASTRNVTAGDRTFDDVDRTETTYHLKASYPFWKQTTRVFVLGTYRADERQSESSNDGDVYGFDVGIEGSVPLREGEYRGLRGQVAVGFQRALYTDDVFTRGSDVIIPDDNTSNTNLHVQVALQYLASPRTTVDLRYLRTNQFTFRGNYQITDRMDLTGTHNFARNLAGRVGVFGEYSNPSGRLPAQTVPAQRISRQAPSVSRWGAGCGLRYAFNEWMDIDWSFDVENRNAEEDRSFKNYRSILGVTVYLNALTPRARTAPVR